MGYRGIYMNKKNTMDEGLLSSAQNETAVSNEDLAANENPTAKENPATAEKTEQAETAFDETDEKDDDITVSFEDLGLDEYTIKAVEKKGFVTPSPIQILAIPRLLTGDANLIARARTGTGKTAAFGLPIIQNVREKSSHVEALILEPTRELAVQTCAEMESFANNDFPRTTVLYGGASYANQIRELKRGSEIVVGTPGRIKDHLDRKTLDISKIKYFILDEGDEMLDMGFIDDIEEIFHHANPDCRILLFSATMPSPILKIAGEFMGEYDIIEEENVIDEALLIDQQYWVVKESEKIEALVRLIDISPDFYGLVFTMTKSDADRVTRELDMRGYEAAALHGDIMQNQREKVLERFRKGKTRILVATDVAARGIDISGLSHVVNYSLPFDTATYVHRIGRTGRAGTTGVAITFVRPEERRKLSFLTKKVLTATKSELKEGKIPSINEVLSVKEKRIVEELKAKLFKHYGKSVEDQDVKTDGESEDNAENSGISEIAENNNDGEEESASADVSVKESARILNPFDTKYETLAHELTEGNEPEKVLASLLQIFYGEKLSSKHYGAINTKDSGPRGDQLRVFVSLGKKDGFRAKEIADFFSDLLHIPGRMVDGIDVAQQFALVSLPVASAKKAVEMSKANRNLPHMHFDVKDEDGDGGRRHRSGRGSSGFGAGRERDRNQNRGDRDCYARRGREKGSKLYVHSSTERSSSRKNGAAAYKKSSGKKAERF